MKHLSSFFKSWGWSGWFISLVAIASLIPHCSKTIGDGLRTKLASPKRIVIGIVDNKIQSASGMQQVTKIKTPQGIVVEILGKAKVGGARDLLDKVQIPDREDAYYHLNNRATNLAITDIDGDGEPEVLAPTYDDEGRPRLNAIRFDFDSKRFLLIE